MPSTTFGTAAAAKIFLAMSVLPAPTISDIPRTLVPQPRPAQNVTTRSYGEVIPGVVITPSATASSIAEDRYTGSARETTSCEELVGEIRGWSLLKADWDGEGAVKPLPQSLKEAVSFVRLLGEIPVPEPMVLSSGHAALYWSEGDLYADLEFLGDGRIAYFVKHHGDKHKGVLAFDSTDMPVVFPALIKA
jgi:hypothetical protein